MSEINLKRFVDINIKTRYAKTVSSVRDTVTLFTYEGQANTVKEFNSISEVSYDTTSDTYKYLDIYFKCGGVKARVYEGIPYTALTKPKITSLSNDSIYIACVCQESDIEACYAKLKSIASLMNLDSSIYGINEKIIIARTANATDESDTDIWTVDTDKIKNFAVKFSHVVGAEMTIAAYLSQINVNAVNSVQDYAFTEEMLLDNDGKSILEEDISDSLYGAITDANMNIDVSLASATRNCGGNCKDGADLVNTFVRIVLHQTLTDQLVNLLTQKIKSVTGVSKLYTVISQELEKYRMCGYLTTDKVWTDETLVVKDSHDDLYTVINKGDALLSGYIVKILPMTSLSEEEKSAHATPAIYVIIADQYGIRKITINGEVI